MNQSANTSPAAAMRSTVRAPLPFFLVLLSGYLLVDAGVRIFEVGRYLLAGDAPSRADLEQNFEHMVVATFGILLFLQILLRTIAARIWGNVFFFLHIFWLVIRYGVNHPEEWLALGTFGRLQVVTRILFFTLALVLLNLSPNKDALRG